MEGGKRASTLTAVPSPKQMVLLPGVIGIVVRPIEAILFDSAEPRVNGWARLACLGAPQRTGS